MSCYDCDDYYPGDTGWPSECMVCEREVMPDPYEVPCWCPRRDSWTYET